MSASPSMGTASGLRFSEEEDEEGPLEMGTNLYSYLSEESARREEALVERQREYAQLSLTLDHLLHRSRYDLLAPVAGGLGYFACQLQQTNMLRVLLGDGWFAERSVAQAKEIAARRLAFLEKELAACKEEGQHIREKQQLLAATTPRGDEKGDADRGRELEPAPPRVVPRWQPPTTTTTTIQEAKEIKACDLPSSCMVAPSTTSTISASSPRPSDAAPHFLSSSSSSSPASPTPRDATTTTSSSSQATGGTSVPQETQKGGEWEMDGSGAIEEGNTIERRLPSLEPSPDGVSASTPTDPMHSFSSLTKEELQELALLTGQTVEALCTITEEDELAESELMELEEELYRQAEVNKAAAKDAREGAAAGAAANAEGHSSPSATPSTMGTMRSPSSSFSPSANDLLEDDEYIDSLLAAAVVKKKEKRLREELERRRQEKQHLSSLPASGTHPITVEQQVEEERRKGEPVSHGPSSHLPPSPLTHAEKLRFVCSENVAAVAGSQMPIEREEIQNDTVIAAAASSSTTTLAPPPPPPPCYVSPANISFHAIPLEEANNTSSFSSVECRAPCGTPSHQEHQKHGIEYSHRREVSASVAVASRERRVTACSTQDGGCSPFPLSTVPVTTTSSPPSSGLTSSSPPYSTSVARCTIEVGDIVEAVAPFPKEAFVGHPLETGKEGKGRGIAGGSLLGAVFGPTPVFSSAVADTTSVSSSFHPSDKALDAVLQGEKEHRAKKKRSLFMREMEGEDV